MRPRALSSVMPANAGIQYAAASRLKHGGLWNTGSPDPVYAKASTRPRTQGRAEAGEGGKSGDDHRERQGVGTPGS